MQVAQYLFQSPSTSSVQVGRLDPSSKEEETKTKERSPQQTPVQSKNTGEILAGSVAGISRLLDVYA